MVPVQVKPSLGKPSCPSSIKKNKKFTVSGTVKPGQGVGPAVKIKAYRRNGSGAYESYKTYTATVSDTTYKVSIKINKTGKYKFKATTAANAQFAANESGLSSVLTRQEVGPLTRDDGPGGQPRGCPPGPSSFPLCALGAVRTSASTPRAFTAGESDGRYHSVSRRKHAFRPDEDKPIGGVASPRL